MAWGVSADMIMRSVGVRDNDPTTQSGSRSSATEEGIGGSSEVEEGVIENYCNTLYGWDGPREYIRFDEWQLNF